MSLPCSLPALVGALLGACLLVACGGGSNGAAATLKADRTLVEVTATSDSNAPFMGVQLSVENPPSEGFFFREEFSGQGLRSVSTQPMSDTQATLFLQFEAAQALAPGVYEGEARFIACEDTACTRPLRGSPLRIATRYTVPASVKPTTAVRFDTPVVEVQGLRGAGELPSVRVPFTITGSPDTGLSYRVQMLSNRAVVSASANTFSPPTVDVQLRQPDMLDAGVYEDAIELSVCLDEGCVRQAGGSPARLTVRYTVQATTPADVPLLTLAGTQTLDHDVLLAEYSPASDGLAIVSVESTPRLHFYDIASRRRRSLALPAEPLSLALSPDGRSALVGHVGQLSLVTLPADGSALTLRTLRLTLAGRGAEVLLGGNGFAQVFPTRAGGGNVYSLRLNTGLEMDNRVNDRVDSGRARGLPDGSAFYVAEDSGDAGASDAVTRYTVSATTGMASSVARELRGEDYGGCGNLWLDPSLGRLVTACGAVLSINSNPDQDLRLLGRLPVVPDAQPNTYRFRSISFGADNAITALEIEQGCTPDGRERCQHHVNVYDASSLALRQRNALPNRGEGNDEQPREPLFAFESGGVRHVLSASQSPHTPRRYEWLELAAP